MSENNEIVPSKKKMKTKINVKGTWYKEKETDDRVKETTIIINKGSSVTPFGKHLDMVTVHLVVYLMFLYHVLFHHVDLVDSVKYMIVTFLN